MDRKRVAMLLTLLEDVGEDEEGLRQSGLIAALLTASIREDHGKIFNYVERVLPNYLPQQFKRFYRFSRDTFDHLCRLIHHHEVFKISGHGGREAVTIHKKILITLWYMATGDSIMQIADRFGVTEFSVLKSRNQVFAAVYDLLQTMIRWPTDEEKLEIERQFGHYGFPRVIGAIDGSHIRIKAPDDNPQAYVNRKKYHSLILQAVVKDDLSFTDINVGFPGSVHDARVYRNSPLSRSLVDKCGSENIDDQSGENVDYHIIGDGGYPLKKHLMIPYKDNGHLTREQTNFNYKLSAARQTVERSFALLKGRQKRLQYIDVRDPVRRVEVIVVGCILHNICILNDDQLPLDYVEEHPDDEIRDYLNDNTAGHERVARQKRDQLARELA